MPFRPTKPCAAARRCRQQIEQLEARRLLSAAPHAPEPFGAAWVGAAWVGAASSLGAVPAHRIIVFEAPVEQGSAHAAADTVRPLAADVIFIAVEPRHRAEESYTRTLIAQSPGGLEFTGGVVDHVGVFRLSPTTALADGQLAPASVRIVGAEGRDLNLGQTIFLAPGDWQSANLGMFTGWDGNPFDGRQRMAEFLRDPASDVRQAMSPAGGLRGANGALAYFDPDADVERHATAGFAISFGQSAEGEARAVGGRPVGAVLSSNALADDAEQEDSDQRGAAGSLVAFGADFFDARAAVFSAAARAARLGAEQAASSLAQDVLAPRFVFDAASLTVAINDLAAQADELGVGLMEMLSPAAAGETALVTGILGAGFAYRHWRGTTLDRRSEEKNLLSSRFICGHASLRVAGGSS